MEARFWAKVRPAKADECWLWQGYLLAGYGRFNVGREAQPAHRVAYTLLVGEIPPGLALDHLCRVTACVNPYHLDPVTTAENSRREAAAITGCKNGHPFDAANTYRDAAGRRNCRACHRDRERRRNGYDPERSATQCRRGHAWTPENTYVRPDSGTRVCRACQELRRAKYALEEAWPTPSPRPPGPS